MILDVLENSLRYQTLNPGFDSAFTFLSRPDLMALPAERYEIDGDRVYATVSRSPGRRPEEARLETHEKYIDIHLVLAGNDQMGWKPASLCKSPSGEYDHDADVRFFEDRPDVRLSVGAGSFTIFFPEDAHMPAISDGQLHKVVVKVAAVREER
jgi:YhcH/YjgK/YiaL family protein